ncbi:uncharacterized protein LOC141713764 [Apium graveolens]|uniref:uncharacterized protein LOC141713764 n=1 Tax=Apium graveolens TaxID=4045 RepID=UPI003D7AB97B
MAKWAILLSTYDIVYDIRTAIKSQALADFVVDFSRSQMTATEEEFQRVVSRADVNPWTLHIDGASNLNGTGLGLVLKLPQGNIIAYSICCGFKTTNNEAEYEAIILGLTTAKDMKVTHIDVKCDSLDCQSCQWFLDVTKQLTNYFDIFNIQQIPRESNIQVDALAGLGVIFNGLRLNNIPIVHIIKPVVERLAYEMKVLALN